jgi:peptidoglycan/xylan/chitin deacetylase (PgdA/CDA1 family)
MSFSKRLLDKITRSKRSFLYAMHLESFLYSKRKNRDLVLMFHNVFESTQRELNLRNISKSDFRSILIYLKKNYDVVSLRELMTTQSNVPRIAITFDDGLINNLRFALPIIEEVKLPTTVFVTTSWIQGESSLWPDRLSFFLQFANDELVFNGKKFRRFYKNQFKTIDTLETLESVLLNCKLSDIDLFISTLQSSAKGETNYSTSMENNWRVMKGEEVKILAASQFVEIGSHGVSHQNLTLLSDEDVRYELTESKSYLENACGKSIDMLAFPFGLYNNSVLDIAQVAGYSFFAGVNLHDDIDTPGKLICSRLGLYNDRSVIEQLHLINSSFE